MNTRLAELNINNISKNKRKKFLIDILKKFSEDESFDFSYQSALNNSVSADSFEKKLLPAIAKSGSRRGMIGLFYVPCDQRVSDGIFITFIKGHGLHLKRKKINEFYFISPEVLEQKSGLRVLFKKFDEFRCRINAIYEDVKIKELLGRYFDYLDKYYNGKQKVNSAEGTISEKKLTKKDRSKKNKPSRGEIVYLKEIKKIEAVLWSRLYPEIHKISKVIYSEFINKESDIESLSFKKIKD